MNVTANQSRRERVLRGFTLVEMLVVITIVVIILGMTLATFNFVNESDRVSAEAGRLQSFMSGARDRAIYENEMRGVRLFVEPAPPGSPGGPTAFQRTVTSAAYIAPGGTWSAPADSSAVDLLRIDGYSGTADGDFEDDEDLLVGVRGQNNPGWWNLKRRGWLVDGLRMRIPAGPTGNWYTINTTLIDTSSPPDDVQILLLDIPYADAGNRGQEVAWRDVTYEIELPARILPVEPLLVADSVAIDLDGSDVPDIWRPSSTGNGQYSGFMDIWFSPRGNVIGQAAAKGILHFYVCDAEDSVYLKETYTASSGLATFDSLISGGGAFIPLDEIDPSTTPWLASAQSEPYIVKDRRIVTLFGQTGNVSVSKVNAYSGGFEGIADDPFRFAESGEVSR